MASKLHEPPRIAALAPGSTRMLPLGWVENPIQRLRETSDFDCGKKRVPIAWP